MQKEKEKQANCVQSKSVILYNKKTISTLKMYGESFSSERFAFLLQLLFPNVFNQNILEIY